MILLTHRIPLQIELPCIPAKVNISGIQLNWSKVKFNKNITSWKIGLAKNILISELMRGLKFIEYNYMRRKSIQVKVWFYSSQNVHIIFLWVYYILNDWRLIEYYKSVDKWKIVEYFYQSLLWNYIIKPKYPKNKLSIHSSQIYLKTKIKLKFPKLSQSNINCKKNSQIILNFPNTLNFKTSPIKNDFKTSPIKKMISELWISWLYIQGFDR